MPRTNNLAYWAHLPLAHSKDNSFLGDTRDIYQCVTVQRVPGGKLRNKSLWSQAGGFQVFAPPAGSRYLRLQEGWVGIINRATLLGLAMVLDFASFDPDGLFYSYGEGKDRSGVHKGKLITQELIYPVVPVGEKRTYRFSLIPISGLYTMTSADTQNVRGTTADGRNMTIQITP